MSMQITFHGQQQTTIVSSSVGGCIMHPWALLLCCFYPNELVIAFFIRKNIVPMPIGRNGGGHRLVVFHPAVESSRVTTTISIGNWHLARGERECNFRRPPRTLDFPWTKFTKKGLLTEKKYRESLWDLGA